MKPQPEDDIAQFKRFTIPLIKHLYPQLLIQPKANVSEGIGVRDFEIPTARSRKYRWFFQGFDENDQIVFTTKVRISDRPEIGLMAKDNQITSLPGQITIAKLFDKSDKQERMDYSKIHNCVSDVTSGVLVLYDGNANLIEQWVLNDVEMTSLQGLIYYDDDTVAMWDVSYTSAEYKNLRKE